MCCGVLFAKTEKKRLAVRLVALAICAFFLAGSLLTAMFVHSHSGHEHEQHEPDEYCTTCVHLTAAEKLLKSLFAAIAGAALVFGCFPADRPTSTSVDFGQVYYTPISLKVRANN